MASSRAFRSEKQSRLGDPPQHPSMIPVPPMNTSGGITLGRTLDNIVEAKHHGIYLKTSHDD